jgi:hypothetical protein
MSSAGTKDPRSQPRICVTNSANRWDDDVIFKNQARGTDDKGKKKEFVNVSSDLGRICYICYICYINDTVLMFISRICFDLIFTNAS